MEIKEFKNGQFQVWHDCRVLDPVDLSLNNSTQSQHPFMYMNTFDEAIEAANSYKAKMTIAKIHPID